MSAPCYRFIEPLDVLILRSNKLFGDPGSFGESLVPPWPSVAAGALRSRMLADDQVDLAAFAAGQVDHPLLGTPQRPKGFALVAFHLARRLGPGVEMLVAPPADLVVTGADTETHTIRALKPVALPRRLACSMPLPRLPVLAEPQREKPVRSFWLSQRGWERYLQGQLPRVDDLIPTHSLWQVDPRVGVRLDANTRSVVKGRLFTVEAVVLRAGVGFLAGIAGARPPDGGLLRFGGDGRAAALSDPGAAWPEPDYAAIARRGRCRMVLSTPGVFPEGWLPTGADASGNFSLHGVQARIVSAAVPRHEVVSGWDVARFRPKASERVAPVGSVYWLDELKADPEALRKLVAHGLWHDPVDDAARHAEGFNRITLAATD